MTIGVGREANGLFYLLDNPDMLSKADSSSCKFPIPFQFSATIKSVSTNIWHYRLGHLSPSRLQFLHSNNQHISCDLISTPCTICPLAKQKRLPFPHSVVISTSIFDLIHCDIWGPFSVGSMNGHHYFLTIVDLHGFVCYNPKTRPEITFNLSLILLKLSSLQESKSYVRTMVQNSTCVISILLRVFYINLVV